VKWKARIAGIFAIIWLAGMILSGLVRTDPLQDIPIFLGLTVLALVPLIFGSRGCRVFGIVAVAFSLLGLYSVYESHLGHRARMERRKLQQIQKEQATNNLSPDSTNR
jgi:hypothetical protein